MILKFTPLKNFLSALLVLFSITSGIGQKVEAESATLSNGAVIISCSTCSGGSAVSQKEGKLTFKVTTEEGFYNIKINASAPGGEKANIIAVDGVSADFLLEKSETYRKIVVVNTLKLSAGEHMIEIRKGWGWINIDYVELEKADASKRFNLNQVLVTPEPTPEAKALFDFLLDNYGDKIISGVMTLESMDEAVWLKNNTGKEPALLGIDFMHSGRGYSWYDDKEPIKDAQTWYNRNGIPALMWHWRDPSRSTEEFYVRSNNRPSGTTFDISKVSDESSAEYQAMLKDIDYVSGLLKELQEANVPVIWRPLHEAAGGWFWWGAKGGAPLKKLWQIMFDRMVNHHGLHNLIWVWTREPGDENWYPGDEYVDIVGRDIYKEGDHSSHALEFNNMNALYGRRKMITISETGSFPDPDNLITDEAGWSWFMPWYGEHTRESKHNSPDLWKKTLNHEYVITLDEMPDLKSYQRIDPVTEPEPEPEPEPTAIGDKELKTGVFLVHPTIVNQELTIEGSVKIETVAVYDVMGKLAFWRSGSGSKVVVSLSGVSSGVYVVRINGTDAVRIIKK